MIEALKAGVEAVNEPRQVECGAPDFTVLQKELRLGNIECKDIGKPLGEELKSEQLKRYRKALPNLILTDYLEFRWFVRGEERGEPVRLASVTGKKLRPEPDGPEALARLLNAFLTEEVPTITGPKELAERMASLAQMIRAAISRALAREEEGGTLHEQLKGFRKVLLHDLDKEQFADMYAQTICYGLFAARCNTKAGQPFTRETAAHLLPKTNPFLRKMFAHIAGPDLDDRVVWAVEDLVDLLNRTQISLILKDFGKRTRQEDPVVHFYETFLAAYDPKMREARGVYYTPEPVVSYIVRSVDHILKTDFGLPDGLADASKVKLPKKKGSKEEPGDVHKVLILDPAAGTGTFLHGAIDEIHEHKLAKGQKGAWSKYVSEHLLPRLFGFELLMAPYAVAHMKLGLQLEELGYKFEENERLRVYLTNTLEEAHEMSGLPLFAQWLSDEANAASDIKERVPVMVVLGNPPYSGHSANKGDWIEGLMEAYKQSQELKKPAQAKWLSNDYAKFIRFAQWRIEQTGYGILGFVTDNSYLDNPTFLDMRASLLDGFTDIFILDLHGNSNKKETAPDGGKDENVFDIQQGVAVCLMVRRKAGPGTKSIHHAHLWGERAFKYAWLTGNALQSTKWFEFEPSAPRRVFVPQDRTLVDEYERGWSIAAAMSPNGDPAPGVVTTQDEFAISWDRAEATGKIDRFLATSSEGEARAIWQLCSQGQWNYQRAKQELSKEKWRDKVIPIMYRPFDIRWTIYDHNVAVHRRERVSSHLLKGTLGLIVPRQTKDDWAALVCDKVAAHKAASRYDISSVFPLRLFGDSEGKLFENISEGAPNFSSEFLSDLQARLPSLQPAAEEVFYYLYAVMYAPTYRSRYRDFLKHDFPRIPLTTDRKLFRRLSELGGELVSLHLLESPKLATPITRFDIEGNCEVEKGFPKYLAPGSPEPGAGKPLSKGRVYINSSSAAKLDGQYFDNVPSEVWDFHIGGYQVCEKWLKDRRERTLTHDDIQHYQKVVTALAETIRLMQEIDAAIPKWPIE